MKTCCIPALYSIMILFCIETCGSTFCSSLVCFTWLWLVSSRVGSDVPLLLIYQQNLLLLSWTETYAVQHGGGRRRGAVHSQHWYRLHSKTWRGTNPLTVLIWCQARWLFSQIKSFGNNDDTTQQGAYLSYTQLQYKTVGKDNSKL